MTLRKGECWTSWRAFNTTSTQEHTSTVQLHAIIGGDRAARERERAANKNASQSFSIRYFEALQVPGYCLASTRTLYQYQCNVQHYTSSTTINYKIYTGGKTNISFFHINNNNKGVTFF